MSPRNRDQDRKPKTNAPSTKEADGAQRPESDFVWTDRSGKTHSINERIKKAVQARNESEPEPLRRWKKPGDGPLKSRSVELPDSAELRPKKAKLKGKSGGAVSVPAEPWRAPKEWERAPKKEPIQRGRDRGPGQKNDRGPRKKPWEKDDPRKTGNSDRTDRNAGGSGRYKQNDRKNKGPTGPARTLKATVDKNRKGFGFLIFEDRKTEDAFIPPRDADVLFHGDRVEVALDDRGQVRSLRVLEHRFREITGRYTPSPAKGRSQAGGYVVYERKRAREEVFAPLGAPTAKDGDWVRAKLSFHEEGDHTVTAEIIQVYGQGLPASADVAMIAAEYNLIEEHPEASELEAKTFKLDIESPAVWVNREDFRKVPFITIDGETARDFDDAVYVERDQSGYVLWVAIADVSFYVTPGSALDQDALSRGTSVYFPERAFHMLPRALSENLCSLRPNEPRLTLVARMDYDSKGKRTKTTLFEGLIESKRRATYNEIQAEWEAKGSDPKWEYAAHFELYHKIRKQRASRGSIDFDLPEAEVKVEPTGEPISISLRPRLDAHRLIEEFMIGANESVTEWMMERQWPFVYRVHAEPAEQALQKFQDLASTMGVKFSLSGENVSQELNELVGRLEGHPAQALLNMALLRSMKQAVYSSTHDIHFGLASPGYTHFTSPIRRYPDLVVHRLIRQVLRIEKRIDPALKKPGLDKLEQELSDICEHCSYRERLASDADREAIRLKQVRIMLPKLGQEFEGKVTGLIEAGIFVQLTEPFVEGMISRDVMPDDFYQFDEKRMIFHGRRSGKKYRIGDKLQVICARADIDQRQLDFTLAEAAEDTDSETEIGNDPNEVRESEDALGAKAKKVILPVRDAKSLVRPLPASGRPKGREADRSSREKPRRGQKGKDKGKPGRSKGK